jgi:hypothetical protein
MELSRPSLVVAFELSQKRKAIPADALASTSDWPESTVNHEPSLAKRILLPIILLIGTNRSVVPQDEHERHRGSGPTAVDLIHCLFALPARPRTNRDALRGLSHRFCALQHRCRIPETVRALQLLPAG